MAKRASRQGAATNPLLTGTVTTIGPRPKITVGQPAGAVADVGIKVTGGIPGTRVAVTFTVTLNIKLATTGTATLIDETGSARAVSAIKAGASYIFENVRFPAPGSAARTIRITNVRANATGLGASSAMIPAQIIAMVSMSSSSPIRLTGGQQTVATLVST
jgi:hypothetical protein